MNQPPPPSAAGPACTSLWWQQIDTTAACISCEQTQPGSITTLFTRTDKDRVNVSDMW